MYDYSPLAKKYARYLPASSPYDWEDILQEMLFKMIKYQSFQMDKKGALEFVRNEWVRDRKVSIHFHSSKGVPVEKIVEAFHLIQRWPWLYEYMVYETYADMERHTRYTVSACKHRMKEVRKQCRRRRAYGDLCRTV